MMKSLAFNYHGSAGSMEVESVEEMLLRFEELHGVKYVNYIGDEDLKTFSALFNVNPYNNEPVVIASECIGHVQKRMGSRFRSVRKSKHLGGKGKLTEILIKKLSTYYGLAILRNVDSVEGMKRAILATYYHLISTDENSRHEYCPAGDDSWYI
ncbi:hypothetical protein TKK_0015368 [Trichogramma kaykai]